MNDDKVTTKILHDLPISEIEWRFNNAYCALTATRGYRQKFDKGVTLPSGKSITPDELEILYVTIKAMELERLNKNKESELEMLDYALGQLDDGYIDLGSGHGDSFEAETTKLVQKILTEYKNTLTGGN